MSLENVTAALSGEEHAGQAGAESAGGRLWLRAFAGNRLAVAGLAVVILLTLFSFIGPLLYHTDQIHTRLSMETLAPGAGRPLGTDNVGYDQLGRLMVGGQTTLEVAFGAAAVAVVLGVLWGSAAGYLGGLVDGLMMRIVDALLAIPALLLLLFLATVFRPTVLILIIVVGLTAWLVPARLVRGEALSLRNREYVLAARTMGVRTPTHHLPAHRHQQHRDDPGQRHLPGGRRHPGRRGAVVPGPGHRPAGHQLGRDAVGRAELHLLRLLVADLPAGHRHRAHRGRLQPDRRRPAGRLRPRRETGMSAAAAASPDAGGPVLEVAGLDVDIALRRSVVHAVQDVSLAVAAGETVGIVGESGCGKSTLGLALAGLLPENAEPPAAASALAGRELTGLAERELRSVRGAEVGIVFQDPMTSLNPTLRIGDQVGETLRLQRGVSKAAAREAAAEMLDLVGLPRPREQLTRFPHELSGGMRQRAVIAAALICEPRLLIADEPTTALDVTTQAQILELFDRLRQTLGMAMLLITHDMGVVAGHADRVFVMYAGREAETGATADVFDRPQHRYTAALLESILRMETQRKSALYTIPGRPPDLTAARPGCPFAPRCPAVTDECTRAFPPAGSDAGHRWHCYHPVPAADSSPEVSEAPR